MAASAAGVNVETVIVPQGSDMANDADFKAKKGNGKFPMLETEDGQIIFESVAIAAYFCRQGAAELMGANAFANAQVNQWTAYATSTLDSILRGVVYNVFGFAEDLEKYDAALTKLGPQLAMMNGYLNGKDWFAGKAFSLADIVMFGMLSVVMTFTVGADQQKLIPNVVAWYNRCRVMDHVVESCGLYKLAAEPFAIAGSTAKVNCVAVAAAAVAAEEEDEMDDLFGDDDEDEEAAAEARDHAAMLRGKAFEAKKKAAAEAAGKAPLEAKSLIIWEVKPVDDETDLQALGKRIIAIAMDGLFWKTEFKTAPIAYGIEKLIIGATIIDAKVSTDDVQELIEEMEDMVQSVDIQSFNKL